MNRPDPAVAPPSLSEELRAALPELRALAVDLASDAGRLVVRERAAALAGSGAVDTKSTATDVVTVMDRRSEQHLRGRLARERPGERVLGEEEGVDVRHQAREGEALTWVLDPIDGTVNYLYGSSEYAVSVAAVLGDPTRADRWWPVVGAVAHPATSRVFHAHLGGGAALSGPDGSTDLTCSSAERLDLTLLSTGFGYDAAVRREQARALVEILPEVRDIRRAGSAALDMCRVAAGLVDAYAERGVHVWDVAAGWLVAAEAGAQVSTWDGGPSRPRGVLACPPAVYPALEALVSRAYAHACRVLETSDR